MQVLVLVFTAVLWWIARRDLTARVPPALPPRAETNAVTNADTAELEQLCATLETLVTSLARRLDAVEQTAVSEPFVPPPAVQPTPDPHPADLLPDPRYDPVYVLLASGVADPVEIARRTGLGRGEIDLILSLRGRRAL